MENILEFTLQEREIAISFLVLQINRDYLVLIAGGDAHIGSITVGNQKEIHNKSIGKHKEYIITNTMFSELIGKCEESLCVIGGVHIDHITKRQIEIIKQICEKAANQISDFLKNTKDKEVKHG